MHDPINRSHHAVPRNRQRLFLKGCFSSLLCAVRQSKQRLEKTCCCPAINPLGQREGWGERATFKRCSYRTDERSAGPLKSISSLKSSARPAAAPAAGNNPRCSTPSLRGKHNAIAVLREARNCHRQLPADCDLAEQSLHGRSLARRHAAVGRHVCRHVGECSQQIGISQS